MHISMCQGLPLVRHDMPRIIFLQGKRLSWERGEHGGRKCFRSRNGNTIAAPGRTAWFVGYMVAMLPSETALTNCLAMTADCMTTSALV